MSQSGDQAAISGDEYIHVFMRMGEVWTLDRKILAQTPGEHFGCPLALGGDVLVVWATEESSHVEYSGAVYIFRRTLGNWVREKRIKDENPDRFASFGSILALSPTGHTLAIAGQKALQIYRYENGSWNRHELPIEEMSKVTSLSIDDERVAVGSGYAFGYSGVVHVFRRNASGAWATDATIPSPFQNTFFGYNIVLSGNTLAVGGVDGNEGASMHVPVYIYKRTNVEWSLDGSLLPIGYSGGKGFGGLMSVDGDTVFAAANENSHQSGIFNHSFPEPNIDAPNTGAVYAFRRMGTEWKQVAVFKSPNNRPDIFFGSHLASANGYTLIGSIDRPFWPLSTIHEVRYQ
jgi:hypothetical protein